MVFDLCSFTAFWARSPGIFHNVFVLRVLPIQADARIGDTAFQAADAGEEGLQHCLVLLHLSAER